MCIFAYGQVRQYSIDVPSAVSMQQGAQTVTNCYYTFTSLSIHAHSIRLALVRPSAEEKILFESEVDGRGVIPRNKKVLLGRGRWTGG